MKNLHITCSTLKQRQDVFDVLEGMGFEHYGNDSEVLKIQLSGGRFKTWILNPIGQQLNYKQFMEQYGMQKLKQAIAATKLSNPQLSLKLGHSRKYITNLLNNGCSTELQKRLIEEISQIMAGTFKTDAEVIAELSEKLAEAQDQAGKQWVISNELRGENAELEEKLTNAQDQKISLLVQVGKMAKSYADLKNESDGYHNANTELNAELNAARQTIAKLDSNLEYAVKTAQNDAQRIKTLESELHTSDTQNDQIRAIMGKHKVLGVLALLLVLVQVVIIWSLV